MARKKQVNKRKYLESILNQFDYIGENGAVNEEEMEENDVEIYGVHNGFFVIAPDVIRRCKFLSTSEKEVLWELFSWANNDDGYCCVLIGVIATNTNLSESAVKDALQGLMSKRFIQKRSAPKRRNVYKISNMSKNPYILLSEFLQYRLVKFIDKHSNSESIAYEVEPNCSLKLSIDAYKEGVKMIVKTAEIYTPIIEEMERYTSDFRTAYVSAMDKADNALSKCYKHAANVLSGKRRYMSVMS